MMNWLKKVGNILQIVKTSGRMSALAKVKFI